MSCYTGGMAQRRFHYESAFEHYLRTNGIAYVAVDEAKRALDGKLSPVSLKNFDFVVYSSTGKNLLVDVKGRKYSGRGGRQLDNWVTRADIESLTRWEEIFGPHFVGTFVFLYWCEHQPPDALFNEVFCYHDRWYTIKSIPVDVYCEHLRVRSSKWNTVHIPSGVYLKACRSLDEIL